MSDDLKGGAWWATDQQSPARHGWARL